MTGDGTWTYARDAAGNLLGASKGSTTVRVRTDQHTDATTTLDANGTTVTGTTTYDPFGKPASTTGTTTSLGYQSGWTDPDSGDVNMAARWYRPGTGSFTSRDSWLLDPSSSAQANRYTYGNASPLNGTDPSGHERVLGGGFGVGAATAPGTSTGGGGAFSWGSAVSATGALVTGIAATGTAWELYQRHLQSQSGASAAAGSYAASTAYVDDIALEKAEARARAAARPRPVDVPADPPSEGPGPGGDGPGPGPGRGPGKDGGRGTGGGRCMVMCSPRVYEKKKEADKKKDNGQTKGPLWDPSKAAVERPVPRIDWIGRDIRELFGIIAASYTAADMLSMLTLTPNVAPTPDTQTAPGAQPGSGSGQPARQPRSCLDQRPAGAVDDNGQKGGWIDYWAMEDVVASGASATQRPTGAHACLAGAPSGSRGTRARGNIAGWQDAQNIAAANGFPLSSDPLARCHFIAREFGGTGTDNRNLAPCFQKAANTGVMDSFREFEEHVRDAMREGQIVNYTVIPLYRTSASTVPFGFSLLAYSQYPSGVPDMMEYTYVDNARLNGRNQAISLGN
ncbi:RHS repeat-associated core domain-containing protein [Kitasatospora sp. NPDC051702]|uniref:RHS repeat-associated core domain-containing protein n=1 Tax=Kitasatospora sp. NPDC051702 TaxID=3155672 RepID=UPI0034346220